jgi:hypothetical protein
MKASKLATFHVSGERVMLENRHNTEVEARRNPGSNQNKKH